LAFRGRKVLQDLNNQNEERISTLEEMLKDSQEQANESERKFDEVGSEQPLQKVLQSLRLASS